MKRRRRASPRSWRVLLPRIFAAAVVFIAAAAIHERLSHMVVAVNLEECEPCKDPEAFRTLRAKLDRELVVFGPRVTANVPLLSYAGAFDEVPELYFSRARLAPETVEFLTRLLKSLKQPIPPELSSQQHFISITAEQSRNSRTSLTARIDKAQAFAVLHLAPFQETGFSGPNFKIMAEGAGLIVDVLAQAASDADLPPPVHTLTVGTWALKFSEVPVRIIASPSAWVQVRLLRRGTVWRDEELFGSFELTASPEQVEAGGGSHALQARAVGVQSLRKAEVRFNAFVCAAYKQFLWWPAGLERGRCDASESWINVSEFKVGKDSLQLQLSGTGWATKKGTPVTQDLLASVNNNPYLKALVTTIEATVIAWIGGAFGAARPILKALFSRLFRPFTVGKA